MQLQTLTKEHEYMKNYKPVSCKWWWMISSWTTTIDLIIDSLLSLHFS